MLKLLYKVRSPVMVRLPLTFTVPPPLTVIAPFIVSVFPEAIFNVGLPVVYAELMVMLWFTVIVPEPCDPSVGGVDVPQPEVLFQLDAVVHVPAALEV
jgi:hypothetical protein